MSKPKPNVVAAKEAARRVLDRYRDELTPTGSAVASLELTRLQVRLNGRRDKNKIVDQALAGDKVAWRACCEEAALELHHERPLKGALAKFAAQRLSEVEIDAIGGKGRPIQLGEMPASPSPCLRPVKPED